MKLREYQAKRIFTEKGIPIPHGKLAQRVEDVKKFAAECNCPVILKPQMGFKGRGKLGLIVTADTPEQASREAEKLFHRQVQGESITRILVEERITIREEYYVAVAIDYSQRCPIVMISPRGGIDIEDVAKNDPDQLLKIPINILHGITTSDLNRMAEFINPQISRLAQTLYDIFREYDAEMVEINPLVVTNSGQVLALDAVLNINDAALFRHPELEAFKLELGVDDPIAEEAAANKWTYIDLPGDIAILSSGAGLTMTILDLIHLAGGSAANFLDTAQIDDEGIYKSFELLRRAKPAKALLVNIFAGLNQCDQLALGIRQYLNDHPVDTPIVVRMIGNGEEAGHKILAEIGIHAVTHLEDAVDRAVKLSKAGG